MATGTTVSVSLADVDRTIQALYDVKERLGKGAYGIVWRAIDRATNDVVAIKKIFDAFQNVTDAQRTFREIMYLQEFAGHGNIVTLLNVIKAENDKDIYLIFEHQDTDLHVVNRGGLLTDVHIRFIMYQIFKALAYMHSGNVVHRDIKPNNILINEDSVVKLCDFGLARSIHGGDDVSDVGEPAMTDYVATRWYRSPEILLGSTRYTLATDMWSVGCILGELLGGAPMFQGTSTINQIDQIVRTLGPPSPRDLVDIDSPYGSTLTSKLAAREIVGLAARYPKAPPEAVDLLTKILTFNPKSRLTALAALDHPYVAPFREASSEIVLLHDIKLPVVDDNQRLAVKDYKRRLYDEIKTKQVEMKARLQAQAQAAAVAGSSTHRNGGATARLLLTSRGPGQAEVPRSRTAGDSSMSARNRASSDENDLEALRALAIRPVTGRGVPTTSIGTVPEPLAAIAAPPLSPRKTAAGHAASAGGATPGVHVELTRVTDLQFMAANIYGFPTHGTSAQRVAAQAARNSSQVFDDPKPVARVQPARSSLPSDRAPLPPSDWRPAAIPTPQSASSARPTVRQQQTGSSAAIRELVFQGPQRAASAGASGVSSHTPRVAGAGTVASAGAAGRSAWQGKPLSGAKDKTRLW